MESHILVVKWIFKNLKGTTQYGLWYAKRKYFNFKAYTKAYWVGITDDRKSTYGEPFFLGE